MKTQLKLITAHVKFACLVMGAAYREGIGAT